MNADNKIKLYVSFPSWRNKESLKSIKNIDVVFAEKRHTKIELIDIVKEYDGIIIGRLEIIDREVLENSKLKFIGLLAKGMNNIDIEECKKKNIAVFYTPEGNITSVAEHVMTLILSLSKNLVVLNEGIREGHFDKYRQSTIDIRNKVLGVIGAGSIAKEVIRLSKAFDMKILCYTPHPENHGDLDVKFVSLVELLKISDFVSINIPLVGDTENFIDKEKLSLMKDSAFLINTSRGMIVNEKDLVNALKNKQIAGAGIDVFSEEPIQDSDFFELNNVILTPHVAGVSKDALDRMESHLITDITAFLDGKNTKYRLV